MNFYKLYVVPDDSMRWKEWIIDGTDIYHAMQRLRIMYHETGTLIGYETIHQKENNYECEKNDTRQ